ncbi:MAG TPA: riboflavin synthase [Acidobacteriota bacterium]|nr:riboflavin synthase [Acidobacteriota bacterium]
MFTGIVRETGEVVRKDQTEAGARFTIRCHEVARDLDIGHSISVDGVCLTVTEKGSDSFTVFAVPETLRLTNLGRKSAGDLVNLEPAARLTDFLGGHLVQGHIDGTGEVTSICREGDSRVFRFKAPASVLHYCTMKGSIAVNGVSLTISGLGSDYFEVTIIPHTDEVTNFGKLQVGDLVNLEADVISKYVESHVKRVLGGAATLLFFGALVFGGSLPAPAQTVLVFESEVANKQTPMVLRVARFRPDIFVEWESVNHQGTFHLYKEAVTDARKFVLESLFDAGVDSESEDAMTVWLSERMYKDLREKGQARIELNNLPLKMKMTGTGTFTVLVDKKKREIPVIMVEDDRKNTWVIHDDPENPIMVEYRTPRYRRFLKSINTVSWPGLRWIKQAPPIK